VSIVAPVAQPVPPSGAQHEIRHGEQHATVVEVGGGLRSYRIGGIDLVDGYAAGELCSGGRGQPLIPWPNRLRDGVYEFDGRRYQLPLTEPETRSAIHGLVRWANWTVGERGADRVVMEHVLHPQPGWPGTLGLRIEYALGVRGLTVTTTAVNVGERACPYGAGAHPYLTLGTSTVDALTLRVPAGRYLEADERGLPIAVRDVAGTEFDFRAARELGPARLDIGYCDLERDPDGLARVRITTGDGGRAAVLWLDHSYQHLMVFTGDTLTEADRRRGLAVEPMTCAPNAFQSGHGLIRLEPGETAVGRWGIGRENVA
jgi:aldose 1-epimerase